LARREKDLQAGKLFNPRKKKRKLQWMRQKRFLCFYIDIDNSEVIAIYASKGRSSLDALIFMKKVLKACVGKPKLILCDTMIILN